MFLERRYQPIWLLGLGLVMTISLGVAYGSVLAAGFGLLLGSMSSALVIWLWFKARSTIRVTNEGLQVGNYFLDSAYISKCKAFEAKEFATRIRAEARTTDLLSILHHQHGGVEVEIADARDPYRHWVIGTRYPADLCAALKQITTS